MKDKKRKQIKQRQFRLNIAIGLVLVGFGFFALAYLFRTPPQNLNPNNSLAQYERLVKNQTPVFIFAHSTDCESCVIMMEVVAEVYPSFSEDIPLLDVVVSEAENRPLMERLNIRVIPTMIFIDSAGASQTIVGPIPAEHLREILLSLL